MTVSLLNGFSDAVLVHLIRCDNDRTTYPLISRRFYQLWLKAGLAAVFDKKNPLMQELTARWEKDPKGVDQLLRRLVRSWLAPNQTILPPEIRIDLKWAIEYRATEKLNALHARILQARDEQLIAFAGWMYDHSETAKFSLRALDRTKPASEQVEYVRQVFQTDRTMQVPEPQLPNEDIKPNTWNGPIPEEVLQSQMTPNAAHCLAAFSALCGHVPFIAAFLRSSKARQVSRENIADLMVVSAAKGHKEVVELLLPLPQILPDNVNNTLFASLEEPNVGLQDRAAVIRLLLADRRVTAEKIGHALVFATYMGPFSRAERETLIRLLLADSRVTGETLAQVLRVANQVAGVAGVPGVIVADLADRLEMMRLLFADARNSAESLRYQIRQMIYGTTPVHERAAVIRLFLAQPLISDVDCGQTLHNLMLSDEVHLPDKIALAPVFLESPRVSEEARIEAFKAVRWDKADATALWSALLAHPGLPVEAAALGLKKVCSKGEQAVNRLLTRPELTSSMLWRCLPTLFYGVRLSHSGYRTALQTLAAHPNAAQMPVVIRVVLAFERVWAFLTAPLHALSVFIGKSFAEIFAGALLFPVTAFRLLIHGTIQLTARVV